MSGADPFASVTISRICGQWDALLKKYTTILWLADLERTLPQWVSGLLARSECVAKLNANRAFSQVTLPINAPHGAPLERGNLDMSHSINMSILWIEEMDSD